MRIVTGFVFGISYSFERRALMIFPIPFIGVVIFFKQRLPRGYSFSKYYAKLFDYPYYLMKGADRVCGFKTKKEAIQCAHKNKTNDKARTTTNGIRAVAR